jgi:hypothetical protein
MAWIRARAYRGLVCAGVPFFFVACTFTYYGQMNRDQTGDSWGTIYTAVAIVQEHTIWLDQYEPLLVQHGGKAPYMITTGPRGHVVNRTPTASSILALPVVAAFTLFGVSAQDWHAWMEAGMLTAALTAALTVAVMFLLLARLTTRRRASLITATFAWGTLEWGISGQALWQHGGAVLALAVALLAFVDRRLVVAGAAIAAMAAFRLSTPFIAVFLLPLVGRRPADWGRFLLGTTPFVVPLAAYNWAAFGSPLHQGYGTAYINSSLNFQGALVFRGAAGLLFAPGRGLFIYSPVLIFAIVGLVKGRRQLLYPLCALAAAAYVAVAANSADWYGGQSFGARRITDILPLLAVLLVPAVDAIVRTKWLRLYVVALAWSVFVEMLAATGWPPGTYWFDRHPEPIAFSLWWRLTDNELVAMLQTPGIAVRLVEMVMLLVGGLGLGYLATFVVAGKRRPSAT